MNTTDFTTTILVDETPSTVFNAVNNVSGWWQGKIEGSSNKLNDEFTYRMKEFHFSKQKVVELMPNKKVVWLVTESQLNFIKDKTNGQAQKLFLKLLNRITKHNFALRMLV